MLSKQVELKVSENPFYGLKGLLGAFQQLSKLTNPTAGQVQQYLSAAQLEINSLTGDRKVQAQQLLFIIIFKLGDVSNRQHLIFGNKNVDGGGDSLRKTFRYALQWLVRTHEEQFYAFLPIIPEYTNFENVFFYQIQTDRYKGTVKEVEKLVVDYNKVAGYISNLLKSASVNPFQKALVAKFLPKVPTSKRYKKDKSGKTVVRQKQKTTLDKDRAMLELITAVSSKMGWEVEVKETSKDSGKFYNRYVGYEAFRSNHSKLTEAYLFSTKEVNKLDTLQFTEWLDSLPAGACYRVQCRVCEKQTNGSLIAKDKWKNNQGYKLGDLYIRWLEGKKKALNELLKLTDDEKKALAPETLRKMEKSAKVNTGAETLIEVVKEFMGSLNSDATMADLKANAILSKVKVECPVMVLVDSSGSMRGGYKVQDARMTARDVATLATAVFLGKNPDPDLGDMFMMFSSQAKVIIGGKNTSVNKPNKFVVGNSVIVNQPLYDKTKTFTQNFKSLKGIIDANELAHNTDISSLSRELKRWVDEDKATSAMKIEQIQQYPVWLMVSDGDLNGSINATESMRRFQMELKQWFQAEPVIVVWDVKGVGSYNPNEVSKFDNLDNVMYFGSYNYQVLSQIFLNINDLDIIDIYLPLVSLFRSNRYDPVKGYSLK